MSDEIDAPEDERAAPGAGGLAFEPGSRKDKASRFWRTAWRVHFYAGMAVLPFLVVLAVTETTVLYKDNINDLFEHHLRVVEPTREPVSLGRQVSLATDTFRNYPVGGVTPAKDETSSTMVSLAKSETETLQVFIDPHRPAILGTKLEGQDIPATMERVHGTLLMGWMVPVPTLAGITGQADSVFTDVAFGDLLVELMVGWGLVLVVSGMYLWWPRKREYGKALLKPRFDKSGRPFWRDLHAVPGALFSLVLLFLIVTGLPWSGFWGGNWDHIITRAEQGYNATEPPSSATVTVGDLDRFGNQIPWATQSQQVPRSATPGGAHAEHEAETMGDDDADAIDDAGDSLSAPTSASPAPIGVDAIARVAAAESMLPGYSITLPTDGEENGATSFGVYTLTNPWPAAAVDERTVFIDQFTGATIAVSDMGDNGMLADATSIGITTHMGTQFGLINRIVMTLACAGVVWGAFSGLVMWWKRRPKRSAGLPRRPNDVHLQRGMIVIAVVLGLIFPLVGLSMLLILGLDHFVIRRVPRLRRAFGQR